jgi:hypothetical protein
VLVLAPTANLAPGALLVIMSAQTAAPPSGSALAPMCWSGAPTEQSHCSRSALKAIPASMLQPASDRSACAIGRRQPGDPDLSYEG